MEHFRPTWVATDQPAWAASALTTFPLATVLALHLARAGRLHCVAGIRLPSDAHEATPLDETSAAAVSRFFAGRALSIVRFRGSLVSDEEIRQLRGNGVRIELWDTDAKSKHLNGGER